jgi:hypothetical protein
LIDLDEAIDPLAALVVDRRSTVLKGHFEHPALRGRAAAQLFRDAPAFVVAWGERAFDVARLGGVRRGIYRPSSHRRPLPPAPDWHGLVATRTQMQRLVQEGWSEHHLMVVSPPGIDTLPRGAGGGLTRAELDAAPDDFLWLLSGDAGSGSGLREAVWAGAIMHVMERDRRIHRIVLWGNSPTQHGARRFADQLGLPPLPIRASSCSYHAAAQIVDAALLLPCDYDAWSAAVVAHTGLPAVVNQHPAVQEVLGGRENVRTSPGDRTRLIVREMLALVESGAARSASDDAFAPGRVRQHWDQAIEKAVSAATGGEA